MKRRKKLQSAAQTQPSSSSSEKPSSKPSNTSGGKIPPVYKQYPQTISLQSVSGGDGSTAGGSIKELNEDFTQDQFDAVWMKYVKNEVSRLPRLSGLLSSHIPQKPDSGLNFIFIVSSETIKEFIYNKGIHNSLEGYLRTNLRNSNINLRFETEGEGNGEGNGEEKSSSGMPYTSKEKYIYMLEKNPDLKLLQNAFELETD